MRSHFMSFAVAVVTAAALALVLARPCMAADAEGLEADARAALAKLYEVSPAAKMVSEKAVAVLVFPRIVKAGFMVGAQYGEGVMFRKGEVVGDYSSAAASYGLQAGIQGFGYALFLMTESAVRYLNKSRGWEIGVGPSVVIVDEGMGKTLTTTTLKSDVYAFIFDQKGLMAGLGIQGTKITRIRK